MPYEKLKRFFSENPSAILGFSGGVDSTFLLSAGLRCGADVKPYFVKTAFQPAFELADAERACALLNVKLNIIPLDVLSSEAVVSNPPERCYHCKRVIFSALREIADAESRVLLDGNNASDDFDDRPGMRAVLELNSRSPLRECGLTKDEIRRLSKEAGLFTWDKPAYSCLATRIAHGLRITEQSLRNVEEAENALFSLGFSNFRVRLTADGAARIQCLPGQINEMITKREDIIKKLSPLFSAVTLDLKPRLQISNP